MPAAKRYKLRKDETKELLDKFAPELAGLRELFSEGIEVLELPGGPKVFSAGDKPVFFLSGGNPVPLLSVVVEAKLKKVVVDMGAVPFVAKGADVMAPGVVSVDEGIEAGTIVVVVDERHDKPLAVGRAKVLGSEIKGPKGKVVKNLHHVGDEVWNLTQKSG